MNNIGFSDEKGNHTTTPLSILYTYDRYRLFYLLPLSSIYMMLINLYFVNAYIIHNVFPLLYVLLFTSITDRYHDILDTYLSLADYHLFSSAYFYIYRVGCRSLLHFFEKSCKYFFCKKLQTFLKILFSICIVSYRQR